MKEALLPELLPKRLSEDDVTTIFEKIGGKRAYENDSQQPNKNADFVLGGAVVELKTLEGDGLENTRRQEKAAKLFRGVFPDRPTIVLFREFLSKADQSRFENILADSLRAHVKKAAKQLKRTKLDYPSAELSVLMVVNNGYNTIGHDELAQLVLKRARNDTSTIDAVIVAGMYVHTDGFDSHVLCPIELFSVDEPVGMPEFELLRDSWNAFSEQLMTGLMLGHDHAIGDKKPITDTVFELDGIRYVRPAPTLGEPSQFYIRGRPRLNTIKDKCLPTVATSFPRLSEEQWEEIHAELRDWWALGETLKEFLEIKARAASKATDTHPLVPIDINVQDWWDWCESNGPSFEAKSLFVFTNEVFCERLRALLHAAKRLDSLSLIPSSYVLAETEIIGQDAENDVSHIAFVRERMDGSPAFRNSVIENRRIPHEHALALAGAYALRDGIETLVWTKDVRFGWV